MPIPAAAWAVGGGLAALASPTRNDELRRIYRMIQRLSDPRRLEQEGNRIYQGMLGSPMFSTAMMDIAGAGNRAEAMAASQNAGSGITGGIAATGRTLAASVPGISTARLRAGLYTDARQQALQMLQARLGALVGLGQGSRNMRQDMFGALIGAAGQYFASDKK